MFSNQPEWHVTIVENEAVETIREFIQLYVWKKVYTDAITYSQGTFIGPNISSEFLYGSPVSIPGPH